MRDEYDHNSRMKVGNKKWHKDFRPTQRRHKLHVSEGAEVGAGFVWHVKDEVPDPVMKEELKQQWTVPDVLKNLDGINEKKTIISQQKTINSEESLNSFELWFALEKGAVFAHADSYCEPTISWQLKGTKTWRLMMYPKSETLEHRFNSFDEGIYGAIDDIAEASDTNTSEKRPLWRPEYEFDVSEGELFVFFPNYMHETWINPAKNSEQNGQQKNRNNNPSTSADDTCTIAATFQYQLPVPSAYYRAFLPRMLNSALGFEEKCPNRVLSYVFFALNQKEVNKELQFPTVKAQSKWSTAVRKTLHRVDKDNNYLTRFF